MNAKKLRFYYSGVIAGFFASILVLPVSLFAVIWGVGIIPTAALIYQMYFLSIASRAIKRFEPLPALQFIAYRIIGWIGVIVAGLLGASWWMALQWDIRAMVNNPYLGSTLLGAYALLVVSRYQTFVLKKGQDVSAMQKPGIQSASLKPSQSLNNNSSEDATTLVSSNQPPVPTQPSSTLQTSAPQNPVPPSDTPTPQS